MNYDVYGVGNALVDMEYRVDDGFLRRYGIDKGHMTLVDEMRMDALINALADLEHERLSGGSAANTVYAVQAFGGRAFYSCRLADDTTGRHFLSDLRNAGVTTNENALSPSVPGKSGRCLVLVTPDAERTMNTFLGISTALMPADLDAASLRASRYVYLEGYLSSADSALEAAIAAREQAESSNIKTAVSLSDVSMVRYFRDSLTRILGNGVDQLFCNEEEALEWAGSDRLDIATNELRDIGREVYVTLGKRGCLVVGAHSLRTVDGYPANPVDTNGAGDIFAGSVLFARSRGTEATVAAAFGNFAAAALVTHYGARFRHAATYREKRDEFNRAGQELV
jgi:sugar/nucleoside kinase (ribokinase family)